MASTIKLFLALLLFIVSFNSAAQQRPGIAVPRERLSLDYGWRFYLGDVPSPAIKGHGMSYANAKAGRAWGAADPDFDDTDWRLLNLPHDWAVEQPFDSTANVSQGYRQRGIGWYRRNFKLDPSERGKHLELQIDGVATHCTVWVNGTVVHRNWSGYTSFYIAAGDIVVSIPPVPGNRTLSVLIEADKGGKAGLAGLVSVEGL